MDVVAARVATGNATGSATEAEANGALVDATRCPVCGEPNRCAVELAHETGLPQAECWCMQTDFSVDALSMVPDAARGVACICARCATEAPR